MTKTLDIPERAELARVPADPVDRVMGMLDTFLGSGRSMAEAKDLFDLLNSVRAEKAKREFTAAMNVCQAEMPTVIRDKQNAQTGKLYAPLETIKTWAKPHFIRHSFTLEFTSERGEPRTITYVEKDGASRTEQVPTTTVHLDVTHTGGHTKRTTIPDCELDDKGPQGGAVKTQIQGRMSTLSYAQGRLICLAFNLTVADEDRDGLLGTTETITDEQAAEIDRLLTETNASRSKFFDWLKIVDVKDIKVRDLPKVMGSFQDKRKQNGGAK